MSVLERCLYLRDVCLREVSVLESCLRVCQREMSVIERNVCLREKCPSKRDVCRREVSVLERFHVCVRKMFVLEICLC